MALSLLQRVKDKARGLIQSFSQPRKVTNVAPLFPNARETIEPLLARGGKALQSVPRITLPKQIPTSPLDPLTRPIRDRVNDFLVNLPGDTLRDYGQDLTKLSTSAGRQELKTTPSRVKNLWQSNTPVIDKLSKTVSDPGVQAGIDSLDLLGVGALAKAGIKGTKTLFKQATKQGLEEVSQEVAEKSSKKLFEPDVQSWKDNVKSLLSGGKDIKRSVRGTKVSTLPKKSTFEKAKDYFIGNKTLQGSLGVIKNDSEAGKVIVDTLRKTDEDRALLSGKVSDRLRLSLKDLSKEDKASFADVVEGRAKPTSEAQMNAVNTWRTIAKEIRETAQAVGINVGNIENYFPHFTVEDGKKAVDELTFLDRGADINYGNFVKSRTKNAPYEKDPNVLFDYIDHAFKNITHQANFGPGDSNLYKLAQKSTNPTQVTQYLDQILGKGERGGIINDVANKALGFQTVTKLNPLSSVTNLTQNLSTAMRTDIPTVAKSIARIVTDYDTALSRAIRSGEVGPDIAKDLASISGDGNITGKWIKLIGMKKTEELNRIIAVNSGYDFVEKLAKQANEGSESALRELARFDITPEQLAKGLTEDDLIKAGRKVSQETQFATKPGELPYGWKTPVGKVATQFKSFAYKQTGLLFGEKGLAKRAMSEAKMGNFKPFATALTTAGISATVVGEVINQLKSVYKNNKRDSKGVARMIENLSSSTSLGLLDSLSGLTGKYGESGVVSAVLGPTAGDLSKVTKAVTDASVGISNYDTDKNLVENLDPDLSTTRNLIKAIPAVGGTLSNTLVPNAYVNNFVGVNNGMSTSDKKTYDSLVASGNQEKAEEFKASHQFKETSPKKNLLSELFNKDKGLKAPSDKATPEEVKRFNSSYDDFVNAGGVPKEEEIKSRLFRKDKDKAEGKIYATIESVYANEDLSDEYKSAVLKASGVKPDDFEYYRIASQPEEERLSDLLEYASSEEDRDSLLTSIVLNKRKVGKRSINSTGMIDRLYDEGLISKDEKSLISAIKYDNVYKKFYMDRDYKEKGGGLSESKIKTYIKSVNSVFDSTFKQKDGPKRSRLSSVINTPKFDFSAPKLNLKLSNKIKSPKKLLFTA